MSNRTLKVTRQVIVDPGSPPATRIVYDDSQITLYFADGSSNTTTFPSNGLP